MNDVANVGFVDPHPKGFGTDDNVDVIIHEHLLNTGAICGIHLAVVGSGIIASHPQVTGQLISLNGSGHIDQNRWALPVSGLDDSQQLPKPVVPTLDGPKVAIGIVDDELKLRTVNWSYHTSRLTQGQGFDDCLLHRRCSRSSEGYQWSSIAQHVEQTG